LDFEDANKAKYETSEHILKNITSKLQQTLTSTKRHRQCTLPLRLQLVISPMLESIALLGDYQTLLTVLQVLPTKPMMDTTTTTTVYRILCKLNNNILLQLSHHLTMIDTLLQICHRLIMIRLSNVQKSNSLVKVTCLSSITNS
jgi:hypothetical protein